MKQTRLMVFILFILLLVSNSYAFTVTRIEAPDLVIENLRLEPKDHYNVDNRYLISFDIENKGGGIISQYFGIGIYIDDKYIHSTFYVDQIASEDLTVAEIEKIEKELAYTIIDSRTVELFEKLSIGTHELKIIVDNVDIDKIKGTPHEHIIDNAIFESNEENNIKTLAFEVKPGCVDSEDIFIPWETVVKVSDEDKFLTYLDFCANQTLKKYVCNKEKTGKELIDIECHYGCLTGGCLPFARDNGCLIGFCLPFAQDKEINITNEQPIIKGECEGCQINSQSCLNIGTRLIKDDINFYCDGKKVVKQKSLDVPCQSKYECLSNLCRENVCGEYNILEKIINWFKKILG